ncbi:MAG: Rho-binding antiterminator [Gammaproteobacteria bacterium]
MGTVMNCANISCELHDYIEIACMHGYRVRLRLRGGQTAIGRALDTLVTAEKKEYLIIDDGEKRQVELTQIEIMEALSPNAAFKRIHF